MKKVYAFFALGILLAGIFGFYTGSATAEEQQSHPAEEITSGVFSGTGAFTFPDNLNVASNVVISDSARGLSTRYYADAIFNNGGDFYISETPGDDFVKFSGKDDTIYFSKQIRAKTIFTDRARMYLLGKDGSNMFWFMDGTTEGVNNVLGINTADHSIEIHNLNFDGSKVKKAYLNRCYSPTGDHLYTVTPAEDRSCEGSGFNYEASYKIMTWE